MARESKGKRIKLKTNKENKNENFSGFVSPKLVSTLKKNCVNTVRILMTRDWA